MVNFYEDLVIKEETKSSGKNKSTEEKSPKTSQTKNDQEYMMEDIVRNIYAMNLQNQFTQQQMAFQTSPCQPHHLNHLHSTPPALGAMQHYQMF